MTTPDPAAIEAGATAIADRFDDTTDGWLSPVLASALAEVAYAAMAPHIRKAVAEEIATAIETRRRALIENDDWDDGTDGLLSAAKIAREIGGAA